MENNDGKEQLHDNKRRIKGETDERESKVLTKESERKKSPSLK